MASSIINQKQTISGSVSASTIGGGTTDHSKLKNRDANDQHPISAITDLQTELDSKLDSETALPIIEDAVKNKAKGLYYDAAKELARKAYWYLTSEIDETTKQGTKASIISGPYDLGAGGGGSGGSVTTVTVKNTDPETGASLWPTTIALGKQCEIQVYWTSLKDSESTGRGTLYVSVNGTQVITKTADQGYVTFDITDYLTTGDNSVQVKVIDLYSTTGIIVGNISAVSLYIESKFNQVTPYKDLINYTYTPYGSVAKTVYFIVDDKEYARAVVRSSGEQQVQRITGLSHGAHTLKVYFTATINGETVTSDSLDYVLIFYVEGNTTPIVASEFNTLEQYQYTAFTIPYRVFVYNKVTYDVSLLVNDEQVQSLSVDSNQQYWEYKSNTIGQLKMTIKCGAVEKTFNVNVSESTVPIVPYEQDSQLALLTTGQSTKNVWEDTEHGISCEFSGFNWTSDGWRQDANKNTILRVSGNARLTIPFTPFDKECKTSGKTIEIEFATTDVLNYESTIIKCIDDGETGNNRGFYITPQFAYFKTNDNELEVKYKENDHVRLSIVVESYTLNNSIIWIYINGIASQAIQYNYGTEAFVQLNPQYVTIGSNDATTDIYAIRVYNTALSSKQIVKNWIADTQDGSEKVERYNRNNIYTEEDWSTISATRLQDALNLPCLWCDIAEMPHIEGAKTIGNAVYTEPGSSTRSFISEKDTYSIQGTSSAQYPVKNIRIKYDRKNTGFIWEDANGNDITGFAIEDSSDGIPVNYFTYKVDYASCEGANNVELVKLYNDLCKSLSILNPAQKQDSRIRTGIDGFPIALFHRYTDDSGKVVDEFYSKANFNNDKKNEAVYGFETGDESWEMSNNDGGPGSYKEGNLFEIVGYDEQTGEPIYKFEKSFEIRFPDKDGYGRSEEQIAKLDEMVSWVASTDPEAVTEPYTPLEEPVTRTYKIYQRDTNGNYNEKTITETFTEDSKEYRLATFKQDWEKYFDADSTVFYYLFTLVFLMVDSREKNSFPTYFKSRVDGDGGNKWFWMPYDMDTALGINNSGALVYNYDLEDTDIEPGTTKYVFNGYDSVLWNNVRKMCDGEVGKMYAQLRAENLLTYDVVENRFEKHQNKWSENLFNDDAHAKYIDIAEGIPYISMLQGSKAEQRKWWLYNRFKYMDSKYMAGDISEDRISFRANIPASTEGKEKPSITVIPYIDLYAMVSYKNGTTGIVYKRADKNEPCTLKNPIAPEDIENDQETYIYSASQLKSIGDMSEFYLSLIDIAHAEKLQELIIGSDTIINPNFTSLTLGANKLLHKLDVRNCTNLSMSIDASGCTNIEEVYFDNTAVTAVTLPNGGNLKVLHLPETIKTLKLQNQLNIEKDGLVIAGYDNIEEIWLDNIPNDIIDPYELLRKVKSNRAVRITGIEKDFGTDQTALEDFFALLANSHGYNSEGDPDTDLAAVVSGNVYIDSIDYATYVSLNKQYEGNLFVIAKTIICTVNYLNEGVKFCDTQNIVQGSNAVEPSAIPEKMPTVEHIYTFTSWDNDGKNIQTDIDINALYEESLRKYTVVFNTQSTVIKSIPSESSIEFGNKIAVPTLTDIPEEVVFEYWKDKATGAQLYINDNYFTYDEDGNNPVLVKSDMELLAYFKDESKPTVNIERDNYNTFKYSCTDNVGIIAYQITTTDTYSEDNWTYITAVTPFTGSYTIDSANTYYLWVKDAYGNIGNNSIIAYSISYTKGIGVESVGLYENDESVLMTFALVNTPANVAITLDSHYENAHVDISPAESKELYTIIDNTSVTATCEPKTYTVSFNMMGEGKQIESQQIVYNHLATEPDPQFIEESRRIITGWYKDELLQTSWNFNTDIVLNNTELFAKWEDYHDPSTLYISLGEDTTGTKEITLTVSQNVASDTWVYWDFENKPEEYEILESESEGIVSKEHVYENYGDYVIKLVSHAGICLFGGDTMELPTIQPATAITSIGFSYDMAYTKHYAFYGCTNLKEVILTPYMTAISYGTFYNCTNLEKVTLGNNITAIEGRAFSDCQQLYGNIVFSNKLTEIGEYAFTNCSALTGIAFNTESKLSTIGKYAFYNCVSLVDIDFSTITSFSIDRNAFTGCDALQSLHLYDNIVSIGSMAFSGCDVLNEVIIDNTDGNIKLSTDIFANCAELKTAGPITDELSYNINYAWTNIIPSNAFYNCSKLQQIILPIDTLEQIGSNAFAYTAISTIDTANCNKLTSIGSRAFYNCTSLITMIIPKSVTDIGPEFCRQCRALRNISIYATTSTTKVDTKDQAWFYNITPGLFDENNKIHIPEVIDDASTAYGNFWNYCQTVLEEDVMLPYIPDLIIK